jgi:hypothetical protein
MREFDSGVRHIAREWCTDSPPGTGSAPTARWGFVARKP